MIVCQSCGHRAKYSGTTCPKCNKKLVLSDEEILRRSELVKRALSDRSYERAIENYIILADFGNVEAQRELAILLENGEIINRDLDRAMKYFLLAAEKSDAISAYRYSRLISRTSSVSARFWLLFSAVLGCVEAYTVAAEQLSSEGNEAAAGYYYALAAEEGDVDAIVTLAKRYHDGIGAERSDAYARWHLDKLTLPPIHAIKLAYQLRSVEAKEPPRAELKNYSDMLRSLAADAEKYNFATAYLKIHEILAEDGDMNALAALGMLHAEGIGCEKNLVLAIEYLERSAAQGNPRAYFLLGNLFTAGKTFDADVERALSNYRIAAEKGIAEAYETMGDIFSDGRLMTRNLAHAIELYEKAAEGGLVTARKKADDMKARRETFFRVAKEAEYLDPAQCFRNCAIATAMGYPPAIRLLARLYENGKGTKMDRQRAFVWYKTAVESGDKHAAYDLGRCYAYGIGTKFNYKLAIESFRDAEAAGYTTARREIERLEANKKKRSSEKGFSKAMRLLYKRKFDAAKEHLDFCHSIGNPKAIYTLGCLYEFGMGVPVNKDYAYALYEDAYKLKFRDPRAVYKLRVLKMIR